MFYIRHHYQSIVRSTSFDGEVFAFIVLSILFGSMVSYTYVMLDEYAATVSLFFGQSPVNYSLLIVVYLFLDLNLRLVLRRPFPKLKYYMLWLNKPSEIASQYLVTSLFGITPFILGMSMLMLAFKTGDWLGGMYLISVVLWWMTNHFIGLFAQFSNKWVRPTIGGLTLLILLFQLLVPSTSITSTLLHPAIPLVMLAVSVFMAYWKVKSVIEKREINEKEQSSGILDSMPVISFKNPVFQLEWALLVRNKRTRSNILLGLFSVMLLPFLIDSDTSGPMNILIYFIVTGFFIIQHGVYSLGWEGSYFDFLLTNISPKEFIRTRYVFYMGTCIIGLGLASISAIIAGLNWMDLFMIFLYNIGITIPLVLYRSTFNSTKIILTENSFMNYNGMMTGPIFVTSFLVVMLPMIIYGVGQSFMGENAMYMLGVAGILGLVLYRPLTKLVVIKYMKKKYQLSQSFKA